MKTSKQKAVGKRRRRDPSVSRATLGPSGEGQFYHVEIRPSAEFKTFRTQDVGRRGGIERVAGQRRGGSWDTQKWLIDKHLAHVENGRLIADNEAAREVLDELGSAPVQIEGDRFKATPKRSTPKTAQRNSPQRRAIAKAEAAAVHRS